MKSFRHVEGLGILFMIKKSEFQWLRMYLKSQVKYMIYQALFISLIVAFFLLFQLEYRVLVLFFLFCLFGNMMYMLSEYIPRRRYYRVLFGTLNQLEEKELVLDVIPKSSFLEGRCTTAALEIMSDSFKGRMHQMVHASALQQDYIDAWLHEVKTPLACLWLIAESLDAKTSRKLNNELERIHRYLEQVLYVSKVATATDDYLIKKVSLEKVIQESLKMNRYYLIENNAVIEQNGVNVDIYTDEKWLQFILCQIIVNAIKYKKEMLKLHFEAKKESDSITLKVTDFGQGIPKTDLKKVFQKGYTGENGHATNNATGLGLYLCKVLADKLYLGVHIESVVGRYTTVTLTLPLNQKSIDRIGEKGYMDV